MRNTYAIIDRDPQRNRTFASMMHAGYDHGAPVGVVLHRQGNPGATALNAIRWGADTGAFSIHHYIHGSTDYVCVPEDRHAYHVLEWRVADAVGRRVYPSRFAAVTPRALTAPVNGQYAGTSKPRGDIGLIGIEMVDSKRADGSIYVDQETRITAVLVVRDIMLRAAARAKRDINDLIFPVYSHAMLDPWTRPEDPGFTLYMLDFRADVIDLLCGREPWRTTGANYDGTVRPDRPASGTASPAAYADPDYTLIRPGEWLSRVAARTGISVARLVAMNKIPDANDVKAWSPLILRDGVVRPVPPEGGPDVRAEVDTALAATGRVAQAVSDVQAALAAAKQKVGG